MVRTTSHPQRRSTGSDGNLPGANPLKSIRLTVTLEGPERGRLERLAAEKGFSVEVRGGKTSLIIRAATAEEALTQLGLLTGIIAQKR